MSWTEVQFGTHNGKTLPQILCSDPDWFFWAMENDVFNNKGAVLAEAKDLYNKARKIKIPNNDDKLLVVEYFIHQSTKKFFLVPKLCLMSPPPQAELGHITPKLEFGNETCARNNDAMKTSILI